MFFHLISRNSKRSRRENGLFFVSLLAAIIAFYIILSLSKQDVMIFLAQMESDAVNRLLQMIPFFFQLTLFILFFLIYFASKYQLERRSHEFGVYLMMGMRRSRLFLLLLMEDFWSSLLSLAVGLPCAVLLAELISLVTARLVGIGIIGHQPVFSLSAVLGTAAGFLFIKLIAFLILSGKISRQEIGSLLVPAPKGTKKPLPSFIYGIAFVCGILLLGAAYYLGIKGFSWSSVPIMGATLLLGLLGTFSFFFGLRFVLAFLSRRAKTGKGLQIFTFRQLQEQVIYQSNTLAVSSLLILAALCCFGSGFAISLGYHSGEKHVLDYTFTTQNPAEILAQNGKENYFRDLFEIKTGHIRTAPDPNAAFLMPEVMDTLKQLPDSEDKQILLNNLSYSQSPYLISLSGYNHLLSLAGLPPITLSSKEAAVYMDTDFTTPARLAILDEILDTKPKAELDGEFWHLTGNIQTTNLVVDRSITLSFALIVPDDTFEKLTLGKYDTYWNAVLSEPVLEKKSLLSAISETNQMLNQLDLSYESYLQNMGRQLFYVVAASYITIYLAIIFLIIANAVMGVQFLMQQQKTGRRCRTLIRLGCSYDALCRSAQTQIYWYFGIPTLVAALSSGFGVSALFRGILSSRIRGDFFTLLPTAMAMIFLLCMVECLYMAAVTRSSNRYLLTLMIPNREE